MEALTDSDISELLASAAESAKPPLQKALRRASRKALLWLEEAAELTSEDRSLEELPGVGPALSRIIRRWIEDPLDVPKPPELRSEFRTVLQARTILEAQPFWLRSVKGDLQMHTLWSDGTASIDEMAKAGAERGYEYIAITDHAKRTQKAEEIAQVNDAMACTSKPFRALRSIELNLNPSGEETWMRTRFHGYASCPMDRCSASVLFRKSVNVNAAGNMQQGYSIVSGQIR